MCNHNQDVINILQVRLQSMERTLTNYLLCPTMKDKLLKDYTDVSNQIYQLSL